jgi:carbamate kinase
MPVEWALSTTGMRSTHGNGPGKGRIFRQAAMAFETKVQWGAGDDPVAAMAGGIGVKVDEFEEARFAADGPLIFYGKRTCCVRQRAH